MGGRRGVGRIHVLTLMNVMIRTVALVIIAIYIFYTCTYHRLRFAENRRTITSRIL